MATLVGSNGNSLGIFLYGTIYNFEHGSVMTQMNHFCTAGLHHPPHDVNSCIMTIKQGGCRYDSYMMDGFISFCFLHIDELTNPQI